ncbi:MAG: CoA transferase [Dehalococcoidia bacterium]
MLPLEGLRVVDLSEEIAGPYATMLLAEQGADVVKVELAPSGDPGRRLPGFHVWNRSKDGCLVDFESSEDRQRLERLLQCADVLVTSYLPRAAPASLDADEIATRHPHLVHLWLPPLGSRGPDAGRFADDALAAAAAGLLEGQPSASLEPVYLTLPFASYGAAFLGAIAAMAALLARRTTGRGQTVEVSWLAGALAMTTGSLVNALEGAVMRLTLARGFPLGAVPAYRLYQCADGEWIFLACGNNVFFNKMAIAIERPELVGDERFQNAPWGVVAPDYRAALVAVIGEAIASKPCGEWLSIFDASDVPAAQVGSRRAFIDDPQVIANGMRVEVDDPVLGPTVQMGVPIRVGTDEPVVKKAAPVPRERAIEEIWSGVQLRPGAQAARGLKSPLDGLRVLDLSFYIAGPLGPMMLADLGADVIKIEPVQGEPFRQMAVGFLGWNRGKRSIGLDLRSPEGKEILLDLVRGADVLVENYRPGVTQRLGVDYESLKAVNPRLVYVSVVGNGFTGPLAERPAFDPLLQARSGAMAAQGGDGDPVFFAVPLSDHAAGMLNAFGALAAIWMREKTGEGSHVRLSLTNSTMAAQSGQFLFGQGVPEPRTLPSEAKGPWPGYRAYRCAGDHWLFVACREASHWEALGSALGLALQDFATARFSGPERSDATTVSAVLAGLDSKNAERLLDGVGVPCARLRSPLDLFNDPQVAANDLLASGHHAELGQITQTGLLFRLSKTPGVIQRVAPLLGEHTAEILEEIGRGADLERLAAAGVTVSPPLPH